MTLNNKAQSGGISALGFSAVVAIVLFIMGMTLFNFIAPQVDIARNTDNLDCTNPIISDATKLTCLGVDIVVPYYIILIFSAAGGVITYRLLI